MLDDDPAAANPAAHDQLNTLRKCYEPSERNTFISWLQALTRLRLCTARFNVAVDVAWRPDVEHCRILTARQPGGLAAAGPNAGALPRRQAAPRLRRPDRPVYLDAELEAVQLLKALGYIVFSPEDIRSQQDNLEDIS
ncbi:hypothetical protein D3C81_1345650 [compost metagenome]